MLCTNLLSFSREQTFTITAKSSGAQLKFSLPSAAQCADIVITGLFFRSSDVQKEARLQPKRPPMAPKAPSATKGNFAKVTKDR